MKVKVHTIIAEALGSDGKAYVGSIAFGAEKWALLDPEQHPHAREAAKAVVTKLADDAGVDVVGEPRIIGEADEEIEIDG